MESTLLWRIPGRDIAADTPLDLLRGIGVASSVSIGATVMDNRVCDSGAEALGRQSLKGVDWYECV